MAYARNLKISQVKQLNFKFINFVCKKYVPFNQRSNLINIETFSFIMR
jgi:hypothetical protein